MSLYDRLNNRLDDDDNNEQGANLTPLDIADLPTPQRKVMFSLLRDNKAATEGVTFARLSEKLEAPPNLVDTVAELLRSGWLIEIGEGESLRYKVNIRRKRSSTLGFGIWSSLSDRITRNIEALENEPFTPRQNNLPEAFTHTKPSAIQPTDAPPPDDNPPDSSSEDNP